MSTRFHRLSGIITATPTPVMADGGLDADAVGKLVRAIVAGGASGIAPVGGTGEATALTATQRLEMLELTLEAAGGAVPVIAGILSPGIGDTLEAARAFQAAGADMLMIVTPYYARPTAEGVVDYFKRISDSIDLKIMLYEIPYRTAVSLTAETVQALADQTRVTAMKACSHDLVHQLRTVQAAGDRIAILTGEEDVYPLHVAMGARGGVLATSCIFPNVWLRIHALSAAGRMKEALDLHAEVMPYVSLLYREHNPGPLKAALENLGLPQGECLPPLRPASAETRRLLGEALPKVLELEARYASAAPHPPSAIKITATI